MMKARDLLSAPFWLVAYLVGMVAVAVGSVAIVLSGIAVVIDGED